jgi:hypothetical protein
MATNADQRFQRVEDFLAALTPPGGEPLPATQVVSPPMSGAAAVATVVSDRPEGDLVPAESPITSEGVAAAELAEQKSRRAGFLPWVLAGIGGVVVVLLIIFGFMWFGGGDEPDAGATQTWNAAIRMTVNAPTDTKPPPKATYTPYPTYTPIPTHTSAPVIAPTSTRRPPDPTNTRPPLPTSTSPPAQTDIKVSLRNNTGKDVNYYRVRPTGEMRYLGWVPPNYYGTYTFPSLGEHIIEFCERDADGNNSNCRRTTINVTSSGQEFSIK